MSTRYSVAALLLSGLTAVGCAGAPDGTTNDPTVTADNAVAQGDEPTSEETGELQLQGAEGRDDGFATALADNPAEAESAVGDDADVGQQSDALLSTRGASLASEARRIAGFTNRSTSYYSFTTYMNEETGTRRTDCSGLIGYIISRKSPSGYSLVPKYEGSVRPLARDYYNYLLGRPTTASTQSSGRWRRIMQPASLKPGDLIAYAYASGFTTEESERSAKVGAGWTDEGARGYVWKSPRG